MARLLQFRPAIWLAGLLLACMMVPSTVRSGAGLRSTSANVDSGPDAALAASKVTPRLRAELATNGQADVLVFLRGRPDLMPARALSTKKAKGQFVVDVLRETAERTQAGLRQMLEKRGVTYEPFWIVNMLRVRANSALVSELASRPEVKKLDVNLKVWGLEPDYLNRVSSQYFGGESTTSPWGVSNIGAPLVWARGVRGEGIVVAGSDTGVDWDHAALREAYRGWSGQSADHAYNWHDAWNKTPLEPTDDHGHGTHTLGTVAGGGAQAIGVAPGAEWIACRNMDNGYGTPAAYVECFQFFLAPTDLSGKNPRPDRAPHVINNSWACIESEGCHPDDPLWEDTIRPAVEALTEAGIAVVVAAGNSGFYGCGSVQFPPVIYPQSLTAGAVDQAHRIAGFSSRGPVSVNGSRLPAPDLTAPGVGVYSAIPDDRYTSLSGTSMATPHVAGTIALLWSAMPELVGHLAVTEQVLRASAAPVADNTCGGDSDGQPNNLYGWGVINADAAVQTAASLSELGGTVSDAEGDPVPAADVKLIDLTWGVEVDWLTGSDGRYGGPVLPGDYRVVVDTPAHFAESEVVAVSAAGATTYDVTLEACLDWNGDGRTGAFEMQEVAGNWRKAAFDPDHDLNRDGVVNILDLAVLMPHFNEGCSSL